MNTLSIETTSEKASAAFIKNNRIVSEVSFRCIDNASCLVKHTKRILDDQGCKPSDIDLIVVSRGPGLWTGIRLGISFAKGLAAPFNTKIYCVGTEESLFFGLREMNMRCACIVNAYKEKLYFSCFDGRFNWTRGFPIKTLSSEELFQICSRKKLLLTGPGIAVIPEKIKKLKTVAIPAEEMLSPGAGTNALLAEEKIKRGISSLPLEPFYGK